MEQEIIEKLKHARNELNSYKLLVEELEGQLLELYPIKPDDVGTLTFGAVKVTIPKRVAWDQEKLKALYVEIGETAPEYIDTQLKVSESKYKAWPEAIKSSFEPARTFKTGKPKIEITA